MQATNATSWKMSTKSCSEGLKSGEIKHLLRDRKTIDREYLSTIANIKRFLERWSGDREFREALPQDPYGVTRRYNLDVDPEEIRILWDQKYANSYDPDAAIPLKVKQYTTHICQCIAERGNLREQGTPSNTRFKAWRERQICRLGSQFGSTSADRIVHPPFTVELSKGCSVGCWFCGVAAQRLEEVFSYSPKNVVLWRGVLEVLKDIIGPGASQGFCYWATDPMDNPDYEKFIVDYRTILGKLPQTTTTSSVKDPQRTKKFLKLSEAKDGWIERFSILTLEQLNRVHKEFTAEELMFVELVFQNDEATNKKAFVGRAREDRFRKRVEKSGQMIESSESTTLGNTIACVSGFLLNMVDRNVKLISPCEASKEWPLGYIIYDEANFSTASELRDILNQMIDRNMTLTVNLQERISFRPDLKCEEMEKGLCLSSPAAKYYLNESPHIQEIAKAIFSESLTAGELALLMERENGIALTYTLNTLNEFFKQGMLEEKKKEMLPA